METTGTSSRTVVITGCTGGIGRALVARFAADGASVIACDKAAADWDGLGDVRRLTFDLTDPATCRAAGAILANEGGADAIVLNAGWTSAEALSQVTPSRFDHELDLNFRGSAHFTAALLPALRARGGAAIVAVSSVNASRHYGNPAYAAAKAATEAWIRAIAAEEGRHNIRANAIRPGSVRTNAWEQRLARDPAILERMCAFYPLGRLVEPSEVAETAVFLASARASGITGATIPVDCGLEAGYMPFLREIDDGDART